jgi:Bromodomain
VPGLNRWMRARRSSYPQSLLFFTSVVSVVPDYLEVIKEPIDLSTIEKRVRANYYKSRKMLYGDLILMVNNCKLYNDDASTYVQCAVALEKMVTTNLFADVLDGGTGAS